MKNNTSLKMLMKILLDIPGGLIEFFKEYRSNFKDRSRKFFSFILVVFNKVLNKRINHNFIHKMRFKVKCNLKY